MRPGFRYLLASDNEDAARLRRLKEIAESNRHHAAALRFHADEMRAMRWREMGFFASLLDRIYEVFSDYGQSLRRPLGWWLGTLVVFTFIFYGIAPEARWGSAASVSLSNSVPFVPTARRVQLDGVNLLFGNHPCFLVDLLTLFQGALGFIFLFLIGLALRNRFRI